MGIPVRAELPGPDPQSEEAIRAEYGIAYEEEQHQHDLEYWRRAPEAEFGRTSAKLARRAEAIVDITGLRDYEPAPRFPFRELEQAGHDGP